MRLSGLSILYTALAIGANASYVHATDFSSLNDYKSGDMKKMVIHADPKPVSNTVFFDETGAEMTMADLPAGAKIVNLWATWCAPCRTEMPSLADLQKQLGSDDFNVVTIATMRNSPAAIDAFFDKIEVTNLPKHQDPKGALSRSLAVVGLPATLMIDSDGNEVGRLLGDAHWSSPETVAFLKQFISVDKE